MEGGLKRFFEGSWQEAQSLLGAHRTAEGWCFRVYAPNARSVRVAGDFSDWQGLAMNRWPEGIWETTVPQAQAGQSYKYVVEGADGRTRWKADPYGVYSQLRPANASRLWEMAPYPWRDAAWREKRRREPLWEGPLNIYEVHPGSWQRQEDGSFLTYRQLADRLAPYVRDMGYHAVELLPVTEYPLDDSWGYQCVGYFAPTARYGTPEDLKYFVDRMHRAGIAVILDWVPAHFCKDEHGLIDFDGTCLYEYGDPLKREHAGWGTRVFDFGRGEVRSFLLSSAAWWLREYHMDGLRVDAVASMLYLDYDRQEWRPNVYGGHENLEAISFLQDLNRMAAAMDPPALTAAEESTAWPKVTWPVEEGGLGFDLKWNMGWMNDICHYLKMDPWFRQYHHKDVTFSMVYAFSERFVLPVSHDEVVHMKGSFFGKMPGDNPLKFAGVRAFYAYMMAHPGKKLTFMGTELAQWNEWHFEYSLDWHLLQYEPHRQTQEFFQAMNAFYLEQPALWEQDDSWQGFQWLCADDSTANTVAFLRWDREGRPLIVVCNFSPEHRKGYRVGAPFAGTWAPAFNTDDARFGGQGLGDTANLKTEKVPFHEQTQSLVIDLPPMSAMIYRCVRKAPGRKPKAETDAAKAEKAEKKPAKTAKAAKAAAKPKSTKAAAETDAAPKPAPKKRAPRKKAAPKAEEAPAPKAEEPQAEPVQPEPVQPEEQPVLIPHAQGKKKVSRKARKISKQ